MKWYTHVNCKGMVNPVTPANTSRFEDKAKTSKAFEVGT